MTESELNVLLKVVGDVITERMQRHQEAANSLIHNTAEATYERLLNMAAESRHVTINVDLDPVREAVVANCEQISDTLREFTRALEHQAEMISQLVQVIASQEPPVVRVPSGAIQVEVKQPVSQVPVKHKPRTFTVAHSDGSKSTVTES